MEKFTKLLTIILLSFLIAFVSINANASDDTGTSNLQQFLGIQPDAEYANIDLITIAEGAVIMATVEDPSKIGGCLKGDRVKLIKLGNGEWKITHLVSGSTFNFMVSKEDGVMKINKTETFSDKRKVRRYYYERYDRHAEPLKVHTWELGTEISHTTYEEPGVMRENGLMYGIDGSYTYHQNLMLKAEARFAYGQVDYKNSGTMNNISDYVLEIRGLGGYGFPILKATTVTPYLGIGYRYLNDDTSGKISSTGAYGYERESNYIYSPIGVEVITPLKNGWYVGAMLEYDYFWKGLQKSHLSDVPGYYDIENDQDEGYGFRGSIKVRNKGEKLDFVIETFIRYWNIEDSKITTDPGGTPWKEPKNNSTEFGIKFAVKF